MSFDIVIPLAPNDINRFNASLTYNKKNIIGYRNIYVVTCIPNIKLDGCIIIDENIFPFKQFISDYFYKYNEKCNRNGWYFQQLIKLYAFMYIPDLLDKYMVLDADVFFLKPIKFIENNKSLFSTSNEHHIPYFIHMQKLHPNFKQVSNRSGICHHMLFEKKYLIELFNIVQDYHKLPFWQVFILSVNEHLKYDIFANESGASEYELYFNYMLQYHNNEIEIRDLNWENISIHSFNDKLKQDYDFISVCAWLS